MPLHWRRKSSNSTTHTHTDYSIFQIGCDNIRTLRDPLVLTRDPHASLPTNTVEMLWCLLFFRISHVPPHACISLSALCTPHATWLAGRVKTAAQTHRTPTASLATGEHQVRIVDFVWLQINTFLLKISQFRQIGGITAVISATAVGNMTFISWRSVGNVARTHFLVSRPVSIPAVSRLAVMIEESVINLYFL